MANKIDVAIGFVLGLLLGITVLASYVHKYQVEAEQAVERQADLTSYVSAFDKELHRLRHYKGERDAVLKALRGERLNPKEWVKVQLAIEELKKQAARRPVAEKSSPGQQTAK